MCSWAAYLPRPSLIADIPAQRPRANCGHLVLDCDVLAFDVAEFVEALAKPGRKTAGRSAGNDPNYRNCRLLCARAPSGNPVTAPPSSVLNLRRVK